MPGGMEAPEGIEEGPAAALQLPGQPLAVPPPVKFLQHSPQRFVDQDRRQKKCCFLMYLFSRLIKSFIQIACNSAQSNSRHN